MGGVGLQLALSARQCNTDLRLGCSARFRRNLCALRLTAGADYPDLWRESFTFFPEE
jgi:hypothetical protein